MYIHTMAMCINFFELLNSSPVALSFALSLPAVSELNKLAAALDARTCARSGIDEL